jgi:hypothetical protein
MTTVTIKGANQALDAGSWLAQQNIDYQLTGTGVMSFTEPLYHFLFYNSKDATHFALKWL